MDELAFLDATSLVARIKSKQISSRESAAGQPQLNIEFTLGDPVFPINFGHSGGWFNLDTAGQGVMIEVFPDLNQVFLTWFTYEAAESAKIGSSDHRWLSGLGTIDGGRVEIDLQVTSGAFFDQAPAMETEEIVYFRTSL